jgi:hypothetical protein
LAQQDVTKKWKYYEQLANLGSNGDGNKQE